MMQQLLMSFSQSIRENARDAVAFKGGIVPIQH
jgi:hypothetical protein